MCVLLEYFNGALYINVWASIIRTIHLSEHFYHCQEQRGLDNQESTVHNNGSLQIFDVITYQYHPMERSHHVVPVEKEWVVRETLVVSHVTLVMS